MLGRQLPGGAPGSLRRYGLRKNHARKTPSESPLLKPPVTNPGGKLGVFEGTVDGQLREQLRYTGGTAGRSTTW